jgi:hypothetical protein
MSPLAVSAPATKPRPDGPVPIWPYVLACFAWATCIVGIALVARYRWGIAAPGSFGFAAACIAVGGAAYLFFRRYRRRFLPTERRQFMVGSFLAFWFYDEFLKIVLMVAHEQTSGRRVTTAVIATLIDFVLVWTVVGCADLWASRTYREPQSRTAA